MNYLGQQVAFLTQHGKERVVAPVLDRALGCRVELVKGYDTDRLGTFTREMPRVGTQLEAARAKARIGMELAALPVGVGSEGAFGGDPFVGAFPWNVELIVFIDDEHDLEVVGAAQSSTNSSHLLVTDWTTAEAFARRMGFPEHHLVVRPEGEDDPRFRKGLAAWPDLEADFGRAQAASSSGRVFLEVDLRAHANPKRMENIRLAAEDLAMRLCTLCPACATPGFWVVDHVDGLPCGVCRMPSREICAEVRGCLKCSHRETTEQAEQQYADPSRCDYCNP